MAERREPLRDRLALRPREAAEALGISERTFRQLLPGLPHLREGGVILIPVKGLESWLEERSRAHGKRADQVAAQILAELDT